MDLGWNALMLACLWGTADVIAALLGRWATLGHLPRAVLRLAAVGVVALGGFVVCAVGFPVMVTPSVVEALGPHPWLTRLLLPPGFAGLALAGARRRRARHGLVGRVPLATFAAGVGVFAAVALAACLPPDRVDETLYHLALPLQYLRAGGFAVIPGHGNSGFPALGEMLFFWCLGAGALPAARAVQLLVLVMGLDALQSLLPTSRGALLGAVALFITTPVVLWELPTAYIDVLQAVFEVVSMVLLARWAERDATPALLVGGWLTGCAAACKYLALAQVPLFMLAALLIVRGRREPALKPVLVAGGLCLLPVLPWLGRNVLVFGNPVFPFAADLFPGGTQLLPAQMQVLDLFMMQHGPLDAQGQPLQGLDALLHLPLAFFTQAAFSSAAFDGVMGWLPLLAAGILGAVRVWKAPPAPQVPPLMGRLLAAYMGFRLLVWLSTSWQMRFLIGPLLALCVLCALALARLPRVATAACVLLLGLVQGKQLFAQRLHGPRVVGAALVDRGARHRLRLDYDPPSVLCDQAMNLPVQRLMLVWTQRQALWCDVPLWADSYDEGASLADWLEAGAPAALRALQTRHVSHLLIDEAAFTQIPSGLEPAEQMRLQRRADAYNALKTHALTLLATERPVALLQVASPPTAAD